MKISPGSYVLMVIMAVALVFVGFSLRMEYFSSKMLPLVFGSVVFLLAAFELSVELRRPARTANNGTEDDTSTAVQAEVGVRSYLIFGAWALGLVLGILLFGLAIAPPVFVLTYMKTHGVRWLAAIIFAAITAGLIYGVMDMLLGIELYRGLLFQ